MAAKKGKTKTAKVSDLKSKKLSTRDAEQVKGGILISGNVAHKDMIAQKYSPVGIKFDGSAASWKLSGG